MYSVAPKKCLWVETFYFGSYLCTCGVLNSDREVKAFFSTESI